MVFSWHLLYADCALLSLQSASHACMLAHCTLPTLQFS